MVTAGGHIQKKHSIDPAEWKLKPSFAKNLELLAGDSSENEEVDEQTMPDEAAGEREKGPSCNDSQSPERIKEST